jgi:hypothetical protein
MQKTRDQDAHMVALIVAFSRGIRDPTIVGIHQLQTHQRKSKSKEHDVGV